MRLDEEVQAGDVFCDCRDCGGVGVVEGVEGGDVFWFVLVQAGWGEGRGLTLYFFHGECVAGPKKLTAVTLIC